MAKGDKVFNASKSGALLPRTTPCQPPSCQGCNRAELRPPTAPLRAARLQGLGARLAQWRAGGAWGTFCPRRMPPPCAPHAAPRTLKETRPAPPHPPAPPVKKGKAGEVVQIQGKRIRIGPWLGEGALAVVKEAQDLDNPAAQYVVKLGTISRLVVERKVCIEAAKLGLMKTPKAQSQAAAWKARHKLKHLGLPAVLVAGRATVNGHPAEAVVLQRLGSSLDKITVSAASPGARVPCVVSQGWGARG